MKHGMLLRRFRSQTILVALMLAASLTGCSPEPSFGNPQLANGWVTKCRGPEFARFSSPDGKGGPGSERPVFRVNDRLVLAIPAKNRPSAGRFERGPSECIKIQDVPLAPYVYFVIRGPWSSGAKEVPIINGQKQFEPDVATVRIERAVPSQLSGEEQQKLVEFGKKWELEHFSGTRQFGRLTCLVPFPGGVDPHCTGNRTPNESDVTRLRYESYAAHPYVLVLADYESSHYGGIHVSWKAWTSDVSHALDIDAAIWNSIEEWNLLNKPPIQ